MGKHICSDCTATSLAVVYADVGPQTYICDAAHFELQHFVQLNWSVAAQSQHLCPVQVAKRHMLLL